MSNRAQVSKAADEQRESMREKRLAFDDNRCIATKEEDPRVMQIVPLTMQSNEDTIREKKQTKNTDLCLHIKTVECVLFENPWDRKGSTSLRECFPLRNEFPVGDDEKSWNLVSLGRTLLDHTFWGQGHGDALFGFKFLGITNTPDTPRGMATLELEFHWLPTRRKPLDPLPRTSAQLRQEVEILAQDYAAYRPFPKELGSKFAALEGKSDGLRLVQTGDTLYVNVEEADADKMIVVLDIQWTLARAATLTGGVKAAQLLTTDSSKYLCEEDLLLPNFSWARKVARAREEEENAKREKSEAYAKMSEAEREEALRKEVERDEELEEKARKAKEEERERREAERKERRLRE